MDGNIKAWRAHRALACLNGVALVALGAFVYFHEQPLPMRQLFVPAAIMLLLFTFHASTARAARLRQPWARLASLIAGFVLLLGFPIGTIIGAYLISASWSPWPDAYATAGSPSGAWPSHAVRDRPSTNARR